MNPIVIEWGGVELREYTAWLMGGLLLALGVIAWRAYRREPAAALPWLDVGLAGIVAGVIGARALHVALEWDYFASRPNEIEKIWLGGLAWHGALIAGIPAGLIAAWLRRVPVRAWTDALALAWPIGMIAAWKACRAAGCGCGYEVRTSADWPGWLVEELPDVFGFYAPRLDVQAGGIAFGAALLALVAILTWRGWLPGLRLCVLWTLTGVGLALLGFFRADPAPILYHRRADQLFDLILLFLSVVTGCALWLLDRRAARQSSV